MKSLNRDSDWLIKMNSNKNRLFFESGISLYFCKKKLVNDNFNSNIDIVFLIFIIAQSMVYKILVN